MNLKKYITFCFLIIASFGCATRPTTGERVKVFSSFPTCKIIGVVALESAGMLDDAGIESRLRIIADESGANAISLPEAVLNTNEAKALDCPFSAYFLKKSESRVVGKIDREALKNLSSAQVWFSPEIE